MKIEGRKAEPDIFVIKNLPKLERFLGKYLNLPTAYPPNFATAIFYL